ncbi:MAG: class I SAM-dependent methyltransferase [Methanomicrobiaceae archaeon]|nr:class I SAM-dependent methyltransferase [Methanomicrobiaceae archaeon]
MMCEDDLYLENVDWGEVWKARMVRSKASHVHRIGPRWERTEDARRYDTEVDEEYRQRVQETISLLPVREGTRVLDIGSGPGTLTIPLSERGAIITAVEPAAGMQQVLRERVAEAGFSVRLVEKTWEAVDPDTDLAGTYDITLASFSLVMEDIQAAVEKMVRVTAGEIFLITFVEGPLWEQMAKDLWPVLHGMPYYLGPKANILWNVLYQMGIYADVRVGMLGKTYRFISLNEACSFFAHRFGAGDASQKEVIRMYLEEKNMAVDGTFLYRRESPYATIRWKTS